MRESTWRARIANVPLEGLAREFAAARGGLGQLCQFLAVLGGARPTMDEWIPSARFEGFKRFAQSKGLVLRAESVFQPLADAPGVVGSGVLNTTRASGARVDGSNEGSIHVFLGRRASDVDVALASGWYPLVIEERVTPKPWIDHIAFGQVLGYPSCCVTAFARNNNWYLDNSYAQAMRATRTRPLALSNTLLRQTPLSYANHIPCRFDCPETVAWSRRIRACLEELAPTLVPVVDELAAQHFLTLSEWEIFLLEEAELVEPGRRVRYRASFPFYSAAPNQWLESRLAECDELELDDGIVRFFRGGRVAAAYACRGDRFGPQVPLLISFAAEGHS